ncbi:MAG: HAD family hydrolase [Campylobacterales bacterium]
MLYKDKKRTIIFDLDGTIVNTGVPIANTINYVRREFDLSPLPKELILEKINCPRTDSPMFFYEVPSFTEHHIELFETYYSKACIEEIELYEGIGEFLESVQSSANLAVATNASSLFAKKILRSQDIDNRFGFIIGADMVENPKPDPEMLHRVLEHFCEEKESCVFIGDSQKDQLAALSAGISYIMVEWGFSRHSSAIRSVEELKNLLL